jgi:hypothetical protein
MFGISGGLQLGRTAIIAIAVSGLLALAGIGAWRAAAELSGLIADARTNAIAERDAHWTGQIAASNTRVAEAQLARATEAARISADAELTISGLRSALTELETANARLPNAAACGLDRDRVRLLRRPRPGGAGDP